MDHREKEKIAPLIQHLKRSSQQLSHTLAKAYKDAPAPKASSTPMYEGAQLNPELPVFNGDPRQWQQFDDMFQATMEFRGKHLKYVEKRCLLLKSMEAEEARAIVQSHAHGDYAAAMEALKQKYGSPQVIYPQLVQETMAGDNYTYDREELQRLLDRHVLNYDSIIKLVGDSLSIFAAEHARQYFDPTLREEWDEH